MPSAHGDLERNSGGQQADDDEHRVPCEEVPGTMPGVGRRFGHRNRCRVHHHEPDGEQQQGAPRQRSVIGRHRARVARCRAKAAEKAPGCRQLPGRAGRLLRLQPPCAQGFGLAADPVRLEPVPQARRGSGSERLTHARQLLQPQLHEFRKALAALDVAVELVEARAGRRQQHGVAGLGQRHRPLDRGGERCLRFPRARVCHRARARSAERPGRSAGPRGSRQSTDDLSGRKSCPLPSPPAISTAGRSMPSSAACVATMVVAFESSMKATRPASAIFCIRCGKPWNALSASSTLRVTRVSVDTSASAASAFSALWRPTSESADVGTRSPPPCASHVVPSKRTRPHSPSAAERRRRSIRSCGRRCASRTTAHRRG